MLGAIRSGMPLKKVEAMEKEKPEKVSMSMFCCY